MVVVNPGTVMGPILPPTLNASMQMILRLIQGNKLRGSLLNYSPKEPFRKEEKRFQHILRNGPNLADEGLQNLPSNGG